MDAVVVTFNSSGFLPRLAAGLAASDRVSSVTIVDNNSSDGSALLAAHLDWGAPSKILGLSQNVGFGAAVNQGATNGICGSSQLLVINPDVSISPETLEALSGDLDGDPLLGVVGTRLATREGIAVSSARQFPTARAMAGRSIQDVAHGGQLTGADWICGALMLWKRSAFIEVGGFSSDYFLYYEDVDICRKAQEAGWRVSVDGRYGAIHDQGHGRKTGSALRKISRESRRIYARKWLGTIGICAAAFADCADVAANFYHTVRTN